MNLAKLPACLSYTELTQLHHLFTKGRAAIVVLVIPPHGRLNDKLPMFTQWNDAEATAFFQAMFSDEGTWSSPELFSDPLREIRAMAADGLISAVVPSHPEELGRWYPLFVPEVVDYHWEQTGGEGEP